jgi:hypothetical protein
LDIYYYLGAGAASDAKRRIQPLLQDLQGILTNMLADPELETAYEFLGEVRTNADYWKNQFLEVVKREGQETFRPALQDDAKLWSDCENRWGGGSGYRFDIAEMMREWFDAREKLQTALERKVRLAWRAEVLRPLQELCNETVAEVENAEE